MKGISELEFIISVFVFITTISFATVIIINNVPLLHTATVSERLKARSWQYSEMLLLDGGYPSDWQTKTFSETERMGFSSSRYVLDRDKLNQLSLFCSDPSVGYGAVKAKMGLTAANDIIIEASNLDGLPVVGASKTLCRPAALTETRPQFRTTRFGVLDPGMSIVRISVVII